MKEKLKALIIPIAVICSTIVWLDAPNKGGDIVILDELFRIRPFGAVILPLLIIIALAVLEAIHLSEKLKLKTALILNAVVFSVSCVAFAVGNLMQSLCLAGGASCVGIISIITLGALTVKLFKTKHPKTFKNTFFVIAGLACLACIAVVFSAIRLVLDYEPDSAVAWLLTVSFSVPFTALVVCLLVTLKRLVTNKSVKCIGRAVALVFCVILLVSSFVTIYYSPQIKVTSVLRAQVGLVMLGISGEDVLCIYSYDGAKIYLARHDKSMNFRDTFEECDLDFYTRMVDGVKCKMEDKGFMHFFRVLSFTPVKE